jgi:hypothetical protein
MGGFASKLSDFFSFLSGDGDSAHAAGEQSHAADINAAAEKKSDSNGALDDAAKKAAGARDAAPTALASVQKATSAALAARVCQESG